MRNLLIIVSVISLMASCADQSELLMPTTNTTKTDSTESLDNIIRKAAHVVPSQKQMEALRREFIAFVHFGPNTFTRMEWGSGTEDPSIFDLQNLDTDQWCQAMKDAGMKLVIITAKHHDGFCLWQTRYTSHGISSSPFQDGKGDIVKELSESCQDYGLKLGIYLSPADLYQIESPEGLYGNLSTYTKRIIPREMKGRPFKDRRKFEFLADDYNEYYMNQLFELLTEYGPIHEVWLDGAHPKRKGGQQYHYAAWKEMIHTLAPEAVIFGREDIRWCGNEAGRTRESEWNVVPYAEDPDQMIKFHDIVGADIGSRSKLIPGSYLHYQPAETNTSIRDGWFFRDTIDQKVRTADDVFDIYERSVGGNSIFLLNIPPDREGRFPEADVAVLREVGRRIKSTYAENLFKEAKIIADLLDDDPLTFRLIPDQERVTIHLDKPVTINRIAISESIQSYGERVEMHTIDAWVDGSWKEISKATNIGYKRIHRFQDVTSDKFRITLLESRHIAAISNISAHYYKLNINQQ